MTPTSLAGKLALLLVLVALGTAALTVAMLAWLGESWLGFLLAAIVLVPLCSVIAAALARPLAALFRALEGSVVSFRDGDFSFSLRGGRRDEIGDLVRAHNELGDVLREQRQSLVQRELLLDTVVQNTPTALVLVDARQHVAYANLAARRLFTGGRRMEGHAFDGVMDCCPRVLAEAVRSGQSGLFTVELGGQDETVHLEQRGFTLNGQVHRLHLFRVLTREISRQEVATWKKVIRVISHELNNSLGPIRSLAHSGRELVRRQQFERLDQVFDTIGQRADHLGEFIAGYARFAKLPAPRIEAVQLPAFLDRLAEQRRFRLVDHVPEQVRFDPAQIEQVMLNLLGNAHESGSPEDAIEVAASRAGGELRLEVRDRGSGMNEAVMASALVPFYSTKRSGTGLGLALTREIVEAHGGRVALANREGGGLAVVLTLPQ
jgi:two-component system, NtrC family, nitrogen regulation sensor histidine kinase NtrY